MSVKMSYIIMTILLLLLLGTCTFMAIDSFKKAETLCVVEQELKILEELSELSKDKILEVKKELDNARQELSSTRQELNVAKGELERLVTENGKLEKELERRKHESTGNRGATGRKKPETFTATAYDLSVNSCGKRVGSKGYGVTANGSKLAGKTRKQAMTVAVDPKIIKLGSKLRISFPEPYKHFDGIYVANDTGGAIKGHKIDIFMGDFKSDKTHQSVWDFGVRDVKVEILEGG